MRAITSRHEDTIETEVYYESSSAPHIKDLKLLQQHCTEIIPSQLEKDVIFFLMSPEATVSTPSTGQVLYCTVVQVYQYHK